MLDIMLEFAPYDNLEQILSVVPFLGKWFSYQELRPVDSILVAEEGVVRTIAMEICMALRFLHSHGVTHRNIKPRVRCFSHLPLTRVILG